MQFKDALDFCGLHPAVSAGIQESKIHAEILLLAVEVLGLWPSPLEGWGRSPCVCPRSDAEDTASSRKSIGDLLGRRTADFGWCYKLAGLWEFTELSICAKTKL